MNAFVSGRVFTAWNHYAVARKPKTRTMRLALAWRQQLQKRRLLAYMLASAQNRLQRQTNARIRVVSNMLKRVLKHWNAALIYKKLNAGQMRLAKKAREIVVFTTCLNAWKTVADRNVRLKRLALGIEKTPRLTHFTEPTKGKRLIAALSHSIKAVKAQIRDVKTNVWEGPKSHESQANPEKKGQIRSTADLKENAHFRYLAMQRKFDLIQESPPAPSPDFLPLHPVAMAVHTYRVSTAALQDLLHLSSPSPLSLPRLFSIWKLKSQRRKSLQIIAFVHSRKLLETSVSGVGKYVRNVQGLMREVGVFAGLHLKRRSLKQWVEVLRSKYRFGAQFRRRKVMKTCLKTILKYAKRRRLSKMGKMKAASHYGWVLITKTLFSLHKLPDENRLLSAFRRKSLFNSCWKAWVGKFEAHQSFQQLQRRPLKAPKEKSAIWIWWEQCFSSHFRTRQECISPVRFRWSGLLHKAIKSWANYIRRSKQIRRLVDSLETYYIEVGFSQLKSHKNEVIEQEKTAQIVFRTVRLTVCLRLWRKCSKLQIMKKSFIEKRFFAAWKSAQKRVLAYFQGFHRIQILRKCWSAFVSRTTLGKKIKSAQIWTEKKLAFNAKTGLKIAVIYLLRNVFRRKATRRIESKASRYHLRIRKQALINAWKCYHFSARRKAGLHSKAASFANEKPTRSPLGPNEARLLKANTYMGWKVVVRRKRNLRTVIEGRERRRAKKTIAQVLNAWKTVSFSGVRDGIEELIQIAKKDPGTHQGILKSAESTALKSDLQAEIERLEQSIKIMTSWVRDKAVHESRGVNESKGSIRQPVSSQSPKPASIRSSESPPRPVLSDRKSASTPVERLSSVEQKRLELNFKSHSNRMELMTKKSLQEYFHLEDLEGSQIIDRLFFAFGNTNSIDFPSFLVSIATLAKGTPAERAQFIFKMLDLKGTSLIDKNGLKKMMLSFLNAALELELEDENLAEVQEEVKGVSAQDVEQVVEELVDEAVTMYGSHGNFLTTEEFKAYLLSNPIIVNALSV